MRCILSASQQYMYEGFSFNINLYKDNLNRKSYLETLSDVERMLVLTILIDVSFSL